MPHLRVLLLIFLWGIFISLVGSAQAATPPLSQQSAQQKSFLDFFLPRKSLNLAKTGVNAFVNDPQFGSVRSQLAEVRNRLGIKYIRVLFAWNNDVQPSASAPVNYSFYDDIAKSIPTGVSALVILTGLPDWARNSPASEARDLFIEGWVKPSVLRYKSNSRITAFQIWNEPNDLSNPDNATMGYDQPLNYLETITASSNFIKKHSPRKLVVNAATTAIAQNYPKTLNYNKALLSAGITKVIDRFAIHYYGDNHQNVILPNGVKETMALVKIPIWVTESGKQGAGKQRDYAERVWPFLSKNIPGIERFYYYQFTENTPASRTYGLRYPNGISDLYRQFAALARKSK